jgi:ATP-dependent Lhr-like helicase
MPAPDSALSPFHPLIRDWFAERLGAPTDVQVRAWPAIAAGRHALITAPTGSGKTLTAFLWALHQLLSGAWAAGTTRVLYVSPLKALNNDIQRNLLGPLAELRDLAARQGVPFPDLQALTRSGDTPASARQRMVRRPPEILITTPESLNLIISSRRARETLAGVRTVILDEIHAVAGTRRGTHLVTAVERLVPLAGEFQRIALSATVRPVERVAGFVGGYRRVAGGYQPRQVEIVQSPQAKRLEVAVRAVPDHGEGDEETLWESLAGELKTIIRRNRSTLIFVNARRLAERLSRLINAGEPVELAYAHHGSLAREIRLAVERRLKRGELAAIVATSSLELGIDIGELDEVVLVQTPFSVSSALQRIGRAGHAVGRVSRGILYPTHGMDCLEAAVMAAGVLEQDIEEVRPVPWPLDVLAQVILSMAGLEPWGIEELYAAIRCSSPYQDLPRRQFELVLEMLAGRYADSRIRELKPRLYLDRIEGRVRAREGALGLVVQAGGTIPDHGYFTLRVRESSARIGELDEEFVWERKPGDTFTLGNQSWRIARIGDQDVEVHPWEGPVNSFPFWRAEKPYRDFHFAEKVAAFLERWQERIGGPEFEAELRERSGMSDPAIRELAGFLARQKAAAGGLLPHRHHLLVEHSAGPVRGPAGLRRIFLHTLWGGRVNEPLAMALAASLEERFGLRPEVFADNHCLLLLVPEEILADGEVDAAALLSSLTPSSLERLLRRRLEASGFFGARFRENAGRALLLPRAGFRRRIPRWLTRLRSKKLLAAVMRYEDFPILAETWRTCLQEEFDLENLRKLLDEVATGEIRVSTVRTTAPSPFAGGLVWVQLNLHVYAGDALESGAASALRPDILQEAVFSRHLRPRIDRELARSFQEKLQRLAPGYAPQGADDLREWVRDRILIGEAEWEDLQRAVEREAGAAAAAAEDAYRRLLRVRPPGAGMSGVAAVESLPRLAAALGRAPAELDARPLRPGAELPGGPAPPAAGPVDLPRVLAEWLRYYGPVRLDRLREVFGLPAGRLREALDRLAEEGTVVVDALTRAEPPEVEVCDAENLERLLRLARARSRPAFRALPADALPPFLAAWQGLARTGGSVEDLQGELEMLFGFAAPAELWEADILPARLNPYYLHWLDTLLQQSELQWYGCGRGRVSFCFSSEYGLFAGEEEPAGGRAEGAGAAARVPEGGLDGEAPAPAADLSALFPDPQGRYTFGDLQQRSGLSSGRLTGLLWGELWAGRIANDSLHTLRRGIETRFRGEDLTGGAGGVGDRRGRRGPSGPGSRSGLSRWKTSRPTAGVWRLLPAGVFVPASGRGVGVPGGARGGPPAGVFIPGGARGEAGELDALEREELNKDRVRQLLQRYGVLFRELLEVEPPPLRWSRIFRTLRLMELSGEVLAGHFFQGVAGLQFASHAAFRVLQQGLPEDRPGAPVCWMNAMDPASLCGRGLPGLSAPLPPRHPGTHLAYAGACLALVSRRRGRSLEVLLPPDDPRLPACLGLFRAQLHRDFRPWRSVQVEEVNGIPARDSPYAAALQGFGFRPDFRAYVLRE